MRERLQKVLAAAGVASRRRAEELIQSGDVTVNGRTAQLGMSVDRGVDKIEVGDQRISFPEKLLYLALNKPEGYVSSLRSTHGEPTVMELLNENQRLFPVGRLDRNTSGLLLFTNDGDWANIVTHPSFEVEKQYDALVRGRPPNNAIETLRHGVVLPDGTTTAPAGVRVITSDARGTVLSVTVVEGRKRQIRLMAEAIGHPIVSLYRVRIGPIELGDLGQGHSRRLTFAEVEGIQTYGRRAAAGRGASLPPADCH
jgi:pseudouridine synthase